MGNVWARVLALVVIPTLTTLIVASCGGGDDAGSGAGGRGGGGQQDSSVGGGLNFGDSGPTGCKPKSCAEQGIECGPAGDGCGNIIPDCGTCANGLRCGGPNAPSKCVSPVIDGGTCTPKTCADLGVECGP